MTPEEIRQYRGRLGLTQAELATMLGVDPVSVSRWERGVRVPPMPTVLRLALEHLSHIRRRHPARRQEARR